MDYATAIAIAVPASTFIVMVGTVVKSKRSNPGNQFVGQKEFKAVTGGIANELKLTREELLRGIASLGEEIRNMKHGPD